MPTLDRRTLNKVSPTFGVFDSGLGGLTVLRHLRALAPNADVVYLADQAHVPYGDRDAADILRLLQENLRVLRAHDVAAIVMGCNTTCAVAAEAGWPRADVPVYDLIAAGAEAVRRSAVARIAVIATAATVRSGAYERAIAAVAPQVIVQAIAAPALVPIVEGGRASSADAYAAVADACGRISGPVDAVVYGCTHFPLLDSAFAAFLSPTVVRVDPGRAQAERAARALATHPAGSGRTTYLTTGDLAAFRAGIVAVGGPLAANDSIAKTGHAPREDARARIA